jgi:hypothetical protein
VPASSGGGGRTSSLSRSRCDGASSVWRSGGASSLGAGGDASDFDRWTGGLHVDLEELAVLGGRALALGFYLRRVHVQRVSEPVDSE